MDQAVRPFPFVTTDYDAAQMIFIYNAVHALMEAKDEVYRSITKESSNSIPVTQCTVPSGEVVENDPVMVSTIFEFKYNELRFFNRDAFCEQLDHAAEESLSIVMPKLFELLGRTSAAVGNVVDGGGQPFSLDLFLDAVEKIQISFDDDGNPKMPTLVVHPEMAKKIASLPPPTEDQEKRKKSIIDTKRAEFNARRRDRKLR